MASKKVWYSRYIEYCFTHNLRQAVLEHVFFVEDEDTKEKSIGFQIYYPDTDERAYIDLSEHKAIVKRGNENEKICF